MCWRQYPPTLQLIFYLFLVYLPNKYYRLLFYITVYISLATCYIVCYSSSSFFFSVTFRTTPMDSTGVPHILEHTVLCGSERFPVRDPFFKMLSRSLATFMNALTGILYTIIHFWSFPIRTITLMTYFT